MASLGELKTEIDRFKRELQQACVEKVQAAEYGLAVLQEKQELEEKYELLQRSYDSTKHILNQTKEQLEALQSKHLILAQQTESGHGKLIQESVTRESSLATKISELQLQLKNAKKAHRGGLRETETQKHEISRLLEEIERRKEKQEQLQHENKEYKLKDSRFNEEYNILEEENINLQKNISKLKQTLVEFEGLKVENKSLLDEIDSLQMQLQMTLCARDQFEKQLRDSLDTVRELRERNAAHQKEIHDLKQSSIMKTWEMEQGEIRYEDDQHPIVKRITEEYKTEHVPSPGLVEDLMKELQFTEIRDLEEQLLAAREEKEHLQKQLNNKCDSDVEEGDEYAMNNQLKNLHDLRETVKLMQNKEVVYELEVKRLTDELDDARGCEKQLADSKTAARDQLTGDLLDAKSRLRESETTLRSLRDEMRKTMEISNRTNVEMETVSCELLEIHKIISSTASQPQHETDASITCEKRVARVKQQVGALRISVEHAFKTCGVSDERTAESGYLKEQILKSQSLVAKKREQISTLRAVLKANKATYEVALANLKSRYENDKTVQCDVATQLKRQIKALKTECQTFAAMRGMFNSRCEDYIKQLETKDKSLSAAEEEKRDLNALLKQAIHQKIALTQRLEEFDIARERIRQFTKKNVNKTTGAGKKQSPTKPVTRV